MEAARESMVDATGELQRGTFTLSPHFSVKRLRTLLLNEAQLNYLI
jgi:hypothetical protein